VNLPFPDLAVSWSAARPQAAVLHLDHAACSRTTTAVLDAVTAHLRIETEIGAYQAEAAAEPALTAGRAAIGQLLGVGADDIAFTESAQAALDRVLSCWPGLVPGAPVAVTRSEYGPSVAWLVDHGARVLDLPALPDGTVDLNALAAWLGRERPVLAVLTHLASQRGLVQPLAEIAAACREAGTDVIADCAQSLGHLRCDDLQADAYVATSRKWLAGPRGVGIVAVAPAAAQRLAFVAPSLGPRWQPTDESPVRRLGSYEAHIAGRVGLAVAAAEHLAAGPERIRARLAGLGDATATALGGTAGWTVAAGQGGTAIVSLTPPAGVDPAAVRRELIDRHAVITTYAGIERAPRDDTPPLLRVSPHVDTTEDDLAQVAAALDAATKAVR
jgi:pyridoxal 5-phosphate dependent beta-lyase